MGLKLCQIVRIPICRLELVSIMVTPLSDPPLCYFEQIKLEELIQTYRDWYTLFSPACQNFSS